MSSSCDSHSSNVSHPDRGSGLMLAVFALALLTSIGIALLFVSQADVKNSQIDNQTKRVFYGAEAALENGREHLRQWNIASGTLELGDEIARAAGANGVLDFDPANVSPVFDANDAFTGFSGLGDDEPVVTLRSFEGGFVAAFLTNDPGEGRLALADSNKRLLVTGLAVNNDKSFEMVEAVVDHDGLVPTPPAAITIMGPGPLFQGGSSNAKSLTGNDCEGVPATGIPGYTVPVVGVMGPAGEILAEAGVDKPLTYSEGTETGVDTVDDISATIDPRWDDCEYLRVLAQKMKDIANVVGDSSTPQAQFGTPGNEKIVFIEDDYKIVGNLTGAGVLWVTGELRLSGNLTWYGPVFVVGKGHFRRDGGGTADIAGGTFVADIAGPDEILWTSDDCVGEDGTAGTPDDGIASSIYDVNGNGNGHTVYCTEYLKYFPLNWPFKLVEFRQR
ncbi:MAG: hypothetical protein OEQ13_00530 [Acidobacteriota bacterium]|nr:hypothetical protein [Acidobacteriota bacterium]